MEGRRLGDLPGFASLAAFIVVRDRAPPLAGAVPSGLARLRSVLRTRTTWGGAALRSPGADGDQANSWFGVFWPEEQSLESIQGPLQ